APDADLDDGRLSPRGLRWAGAIMQLPCTNCSRVLEFVGDRPSFCAYCGHPLSEPKVTATTAPTSPPADLVVKFNGGPADTVGPYRLLRPIGSGGMGTVYEAEEAASGRRVALKLLDSDATESSEAMQRFRQEGRLMSQLAHPNC